MMKQRLVVFFDETCELCRTFKRYVTKFDTKQRLLWYSLQRAKTENTYPHIPTEQMAKEIHVLEEETYLYTGFAGIKRIMHELPLGRMIVPFFSFPCAHVVGDFLYKKIANNRHRFFCKK